MSSYNVIVTFGTWSWPPGGSTISTRWHLFVIVHLGDVKRVQHQDMMVVLGQGNNVSLWGDLQSTAAAHLHIRTLKLSDQRPFTLEHSDMESVSMAVTNEHITSITDVNAVGEVGDVLTANTAQELTVLSKYHHAVTLKI